MPSTVYGKTTVRILHLEDDARDALLIQQQLTRDKDAPPATICLVTTEEEFLAELAKECPDIILCDYSIPNYGGLDALQSAKKRCPDVPVIVIAETMDEDRAVASLKMGATDYLLKNDLHRVLPSIRRALRDADREREHRAIERDLRRKEEDLKEAQRIGRMGEWYFDPYTGKLILSEELCRLYGFDMTPTGFPLKDYGEMLSHEGWTQVDETIERALKTGEPCELDMEVRTRDGRTVWFMARGQTVRDAEGEVVGLRGTAQDITERKLIQKALERSEEELRNTIRYAPTFIYEIDFRGPRFTSVNEAMCTFSGLSREELLAMNPLDFLSEEGKVTFRRRIEQWLHKEKPQEDVEYKVRLKDGQEHWVILNVTFTADEQGMPRGATVIGHDITERRRAEEALRESEEKFRALSDASPAAVLVYRGDKHIYANPAAASIFGYSQEELLAMNFIEHIHPSSREIVQALAAARMRGEQKPARYEVRAITKSGEEKWLDVSSSLVRFGAAPAGLVICVDITERKRVEEALRESERRYRILHESMRDAFVQVSMDGQIVQCNDLYGEMLGYSFEEVRALTYRDVTPERWHTFEEQIVREQIIPRGYSDIYEKEYRRKDGTIIPVELRTILVRDAASQPAAMWAIVRDISERKQAEAALKESETRFRTLADSTPVMLWVTNERGDIQMVNHAYEEFIGITEEQLRSPGSWQPLVHPEDREQYVKTVLEAIAEQKPFDAEARVRHRSGQWHWIHSYAAPRFDSTGKFLGHVGSSPDVTHLKLAEESMRRSEENLRLMVEAATEPMMVVNDEGLIEAASNAGSRLLGYRDGELVGRSVADFAKPMSRVELAYRLEDLHKYAPQPLVTSYLVRTKSGRLEWMTIEAILASAGQLKERYLLKFQKLNFDAF